VTAEDFRRAFAELTMTQERFQQLAASLREKPAEELFGLLWPVALDTLSSPADQWASQLLVQLEPWCPMTCEDALRAVATSELNLSNRLVPFYLAAQFGKRKVAKAYRVLVPAEFPGEVPPALGGILYWLSFPTIDLVEWFAEWRCRRPEAEPLSWPTNLNKNENLGRAKRPS
jgi:hypothetical protein